jgi:hypothetical protein
MKSKSTDENLIDNGGRRKDKERRNFNYTAHIPERRSGDDRRDGRERRNKKRIPEEEAPETSEKDEEK